MTENTFFVITSQFRLKNPGNLINDKPLNDYEENEVPRKWSI